LADRGEAIGLIGARVFHRVRQYDTQHRRFGPIDFRIYRCLGAETDLDAFALHEQAFDRVLLAVWRQLLRALADRGSDHVVDPVDCVAFEADVEDHQTLFSPGDRREVVELSEPLARLIRRWRELIPQRAAEWHGHESSRQGRVSDHGGQRVGDEVAVPAQDEDVLSAGELAQEALHHHAKVRHRGSEVGAIVAKLLLGDRQALRCCHRHDISIRQAYQIRSPRSYLEIGERRALLAKPAAQDTDQLLNAKCEAARSVEVRKPQRLQGAPQVAPHGAKRIEPYVQQSARRAPKARGGLGDGRSNSIHW